MKEFEIEKNELVGVKFLWKLGKIDVDRVTFVKYGIKRMMSIMDDNKETIVLDEIAGDETHKCTSDVILQLGGKVGDVIKGFKLEKKGKAGVKVVKIINLESV